MSHPALPVWPPSRAELHPRPTCSDWTSRHHNLSARATSPFCWGRNEKLIPNSRRAFIPGYRWKNTALRDPRWRVNSWLRPNMSPVRRFSLEIPWQLHCLLQYRSHLRLPLVLSEDSRKCWGPAAESCTEVFNTLNDTYKISFVSDLELLGAFARL